MDFDAHPPRPPLRAHFAAAVRNRTSRDRAVSRCAAEPLEDRRLLTVSILTPYQHDVEGNTAAFFADFTADARPGDAYVGWGDGTIDQLENRMMDYDPATGRGRVYGIHEYSTPGDWTVTFAVKRGASMDAETFFAHTTGEVPETAGADMINVSEASAMSMDSSSAEAMTVEPAGSAPPEVVAVYVSSASWTAPFKAYLGNEAYGFSVSASDQLNELPWSNLNQVSVTFSEDVVVAPTDLLVRGVKFADYPVTGVVYNAGTRTATWTLGRTLAAHDPTVPASGDKVVLHLTNFITDRDAGNRLDGEWPTAANAFPSGDGISDGVFDFRINVQPGDATRDGAVNSLDLSDVKRRVNHTLGPPVGALYTAYHDLDGTGSINAIDVSTVEARMNERLPAGEPVAPAVPDAPDGLWIGQYSSTELGLSWSDQSFNEVGFGIERSTTGTGGWFRRIVPGPDAEGYLDTALWADTTYYYRVFAYNSAGAAPYSNVGDNRTLSSVPTAPSTVALTARSPTQIDVTWDDNSPNETGFRVERSDNDGQYIYIADVPANVRIFQDLNVPEVGSYVYRVAAFNSGGDSAYASASFPTTTIPRAPTLVSAVDAGNGALRLSWTDNAINELGYDAEVSTDGVTWQMQMMPASENSTAGHVGMAPGTYQVRMVAINRGGEAASQPLTVTVASEPDPSAWEVTLLSGGGPWPESSGGFEFTVDRYRRGALVPPSTSLTVELYPPEGSATEGVDYEPLPRQVVIPANQWTAKIPVRIINDAVFEQSPGGDGNEELVALTIKATPTYIANGFMNATILDDDPKVEIVADTDGDHMGDEFGGQLALARIGHWGTDAAFAAGSGLSGYRADGSIRDWLGGPNADPNLNWDNFIDRDPNRFYVRVRNPKANTNPNAVEYVTATVGTLTKGSVPADNQTPISLSETGPNTGVFVSKSQLLVMPDFVLAPNDPAPADAAHYNDDDWPVHDGFNGGVKVEDDQHNDRTHYAPSISGMVRAEYLGANAVEVPLFRTADGKQDIRRAVRIRVTVFNEPGFVDANNDGIHDGGMFKDINGDGIANTVLGSRQAALNYVAAQVLRTNALFSPAAIEITQANVSFADAVVNGKNYLDDGLMDYQSAFNEVTRMAEKYGATARSDVLDVFFTGTLREANKFQRPGTTLNVATVTAKGEPLFDGQGDNQFVFVSSVLPALGPFASPAPVRSNVLAHEILHALTNLPDAAAPLHVLFPLTKAQLDDPAHYRRVPLQLVGAAQTTRTSINAGGKRGDRGNMLLKPYPIQSE